MTDSEVARAGEAPDEPGPREMIGPEQVDWGGIARNLHEFWRMSGYLFALPNNDKAVLFLVFVWWPIAVSILFLVYCTIGAYLLGLAVVTVGMSRPLPARWPTITALVVGSCVAAVAAVVFPLLGQSSSFVLHATTSVAFAVVACVMLLRRHLQYSDQWQPRLPRKGIPGYLWGLIK